MPIAIPLGSFWHSCFISLRKCDRLYSWTKQKMIGEGFVNDDRNAIFKQHTVDNKHSSCLSGALITFFAGLSR